MSMRRQVVAGVAALCVIGAAVPGFGQDVNLGYRWTKGEQWRTRLTQHVNTTQSTAEIPESPGNPSVKSTMSQVFRTTVQTVAADGSATLRHVIESVHMEFNTPVEKTVFDSASTEVRPATDRLGRAMGAAYSAMIGEPVTVVVSPSGTVHKIEGMGRLMERVLNAQPQDRVAPDVLDGLRNTFRDDPTADMLGWGIALFPNRPLHPGDTWEDHLKATVPILGATTTSRTWTLQEFQREGGVSMARVTAKLTIKADPSTAQSVFGPVAMQTGDSDGESELFFDIAKGRLQRLTTSITQSMSIATGASNGGRMSTPILVKSTLTLERLEVP